jgi:hypothetical protein
MTIGAIGCKTADLSDLGSNKPGFKAKFCFKKTQIQITEQS